MVEVLIYIDEHGDSKVEVKGVDGPQCKSLTAAIEKALGKTQHVIEKPEFMATRSLGRKVGL